jgi:hypothetical protein
VNAIKVAFPTFGLLSGITSGITDYAMNQVASSNRNANLRQIEATEQRQKPNVTININKGNVTAQEIAKAVNKSTKTSGAPKLNFGTVRAN